MKSKSRNKIISKVFMISFVFISVIGLAYTTYPYVNAIYFNSNNRFSKSILISNNQGDFIGTTNDKNPTPENYSINIDEIFEKTNKALNLGTISHPELEFESGEMKLTIQKLNLKKLPVVINVNSYDKNIYMPILESKLAHFKGTSLPSKQGNTFIYGHSTNELWARTNPTHPMFAFTYLNKLDIGDEINLEYRGTTYKYTLQKIRIVPPDDVSPILSYANKKTLTLMTCWPPGVGTDRLILVANQQEI